jgi:hypothetical protein
MNWSEPRRMADRSGLVRVAFGDHRVGGGNGMAGGRLGRVRGTASAGRFPMGTAAGAPQRLTKLYLGNCARTEEAGSRSRRKRKDSHDLLEVVVELESVTEQLGHRYLVCRLPLAFAQLDPELPGAQGADADVCHLFVSLEVVPSAGWVLPDPKNPRLAGRRQHPADSAPPRRCRSARRPRRPRPAPPGQIRVAMPGRGLALGLARRLFDAGRVARPGGQVTGVEKRACRCRSRR